MRAILFDIDGTLVRTGGAGKAAMEAALCEEFGVRLNSEEIPYSGRTDRAIGRDLLAAHGIEPTANQTKLVEGYLARLPYYLGRFPGRVCPGVTELLAELRKRSDVVLGLLDRQRAGAGRSGSWGTTGCGRTSRSAGSATTTRTATTWPGRRWGRWSSTSAARWTRRTCG